MGAPHLHTHARTLVSTHRVLERLGRKTWGSWLRSCFCAGGREERRPLQSYAGMVVGHYNATQVDIAQHHTSHHNTHNTRLVEDYCVFLSVFAKHIRTPAHPIKESIVHPFTLPSERPQPGVTTKSCYLFLRSINVLPKTERKHSKKTPPSSRS